jgi:Spy/CpxP family protein refolding chaperone
MMKKLKLTPEQEAKITELRKQDSELISAKYQSMRDSRAQLHEMQKNGDYDEAKVKALTEQGAQAMAEMAQLRARQHHQMMEVLSPAAAPAVRSAARGKDEALGEKTRRQACQPDLSRAGPAARAA